MASRAWVDVQSPHADCRVSCQVESQGGQPKRGGCFGGAFRGDARCHDLQAVLLDGRSSRRPALHALLGSCSRAWGAESSAICVHRAQVVKADRLGLMQLHVMWGTHARAAFCPVQAVPGPKQSPQRFDAVCDRTPEPPLLFPAHTASL